MCKRGLEPLFIMFVCCIAYRACEIKFKSQNTLSCKSERSNASPMVGQAPCVFTFQARSLLHAEMPCQHQHGEVPRADTCACHARQKRTRRDSQLMEVEGAKAREQPSSTAQGSRWQWHRVAACPGSPWQLINVLNAQRVARFGALGT